MLATTTQVTTAEELPDGTRLLVRPITAGDKELLATGLARLSPESRHKRFLAAKPRFTASELRYLTEIDGHRHIAFAAVLADDPQTLVAVARCVRSPAEPDLAELAIAIGDPWQGQGLGRRLSALVADEARRHGVRRISAATLPDNAAAIALVRGLARGGIELDRFEGAIRELVVRL